MRDTNYTNCRELILERADLCQFVKFVSHACSVSFRFLIRVGPCASVVHNLILSSQPPTYSLVRHRNQSKP